MADKTKMVLSKMKKAGKPVRPGDVMNCPEQNLTWQ